MDLNEREKLSFEDFALPSGLLLGLYAMGFQHGPSDTQALILSYSLPEQLQRNIIVQAKTGTGKTVHIYTILFDLLFIPCFRFPTSYMLLLVFNLHHKF